MKIIFLDIDGVLNSDKPIHDWIEIHGNNNPAMPDFYDIQPDKVNLLKQIVEKTDAKIVISSSWRLGYMKKITEILNKYGIEVIGKTPYGVRMDVRDDRCNDWCEHTFDYDFPVTFDRGCECLNYLSKHSSDNIESYIVIDDEVHDIAQWIDEDHVVKTTTWDGLTEELAQKAIFLLNKR